MDLEQSYDYTLDRISNFNDSTLDLVLHSTLVQISKTDITNKKVINAIDDFAKCCNFKHKNGLKIYACSVILSIYLDKIPNKKA